MMIKNANDPILHSITMSKGAERMNHMIMNGYETTKVIFI